jgi:hypothetical protein
MVRDAYTQRPSGENAGVTAAAHRSASLRPSSTWTRGPRPAAAGAIGITQSSQST